MPKQIRRKLFLFGRYSVALLPPKHWLNELGLKAGDLVVLEIDRKRQRLLIHSNYQELPAKKSLSSPHKQPPDSQTTDWQPIPQLP